MIYDLAPGVNIETDGDSPAGGAHIIDAEALEKARERWNGAKRQTPKLHEEIARSLGAHVYVPPTDETTHIAVDAALLAEALDDETLERVTGVPADVARRIAEGSQTDT